MRESEDKLRDHTERLRLGDERMRAADERLRSQETDLQILTRTSSELLMPSAISLIVCSSHSSRRLCTVI